MCITPFRKKLDKGQGMIDLPCGNCYACLYNRRREWTTRLIMEAKSSDFSYFLTLTYDDDHVPINENYVMSLRKKDVQDFMKLLRYYSKAKIRYYLAGEYGTHTNRPHYHAILFSDKKIDVDIVLKSWSQGQVLLKTASDATMGYVAKYHLISSKDLNGAEKPFQLMSRRPGIGKCYVDNNANVEYHLADEYNRTRIHQNGKVVPLPKYIKRKIYTKSTLMEMGKKIVSEYPDGFELLQKLNIANERERRKQKSKL